MNSGDLLVGFFKLNFKDTLKVCLEGDLRWLLGCCSGHQVVPMDMNCGGLLAVNDKLHERVFIDLELLDPSKWLAVSDVNHRSVGR